MTGKLTRKQIREGLETVPIEGILGKAVSSQLTAKQKRFALEVAKGSTKADAYRRAYKADASRNTLVSKPYLLMRDERVRAEVEAYEAAIEAAKYRTPAALRELVIQSLVSVVINPDAKDSVKVAAAKVLGTVTEVAAFTERKEVRTISSSEDARTKIMGELRRLITDSATDATIVETQADDLLRELSGPDMNGDANAMECNDAETGAAEIQAEDADSESPSADTHPAPAPQDQSDARAPHLLTIPPEKSDSGSVFPPTE